jgi:hypothetical protein
MANVEPEVRNGIEFHKGHTKILLVAPHGVKSEPLDDIGTAELAKEIQKHLGCSAVINTTYRKPTGKEPEKRNGGKPSFEAEVLNLNLVEQAQKHPEFINALKEVAESDGLTYAFWIHGIADKNITDGNHCFIGYGQPNQGEEKRHTAEDAVIQKLVEQFDALGIKAVKATIESKYRGWKKSYMNQWFRSQKKYGLDEVQSIQLEFKKTGFRRKQDIQEKAERIAQAISALIPPEIEIVAPDSEDPIVEKAYNKLAQVFSKNYERALMEAGQYIVRTFYGGEEGIEGNEYDKNFNYEDIVIENARNNDSPLGDSLNRLYNKISGEKAHNTPSRSWIYNAVNLVALQHDMKKLLKKDYFQTFGNLLLSQKLLLFPVKDSDRQKMVEYCHDKDKALTVKEFRGVLNDSQSTEETGLLELPALLKKPEELEKEENASRLAPERLVEEKKSTLKRLKNIAKAKHDSAQSKINRLKDELEKWEKISKTYVTTIANIEKAIELKGRKAKKKAAKRKPKSPNIISVSRRTDIPACYSDWFFNRLKEGFVQSRKNTTTKPKKVSLKPEDVRCFVFWTKNPGPMMDRLDKLNGYHFYFQFTLTPYGQDFEGAVLPNKAELTQTFIQLSQKIGKGKVIWRYDPILLTDKIDIDFHKTEFSKLAESLQGYTDKCVISFIDTGYLSAETKEQLKLKKITKDQMREIAKEFQPIAEKNGMKIETCSEKIDLSEYGIFPSKCIDDKIVGTLIGKEFSLKKDTSQRKACGCVESIDIGTDNTCNNGCQYCYATKDHKQARLNFHEHDNTSPLLVGRENSNPNQNWADDDVPNS